MPRLFNPWAHSRTEPEFSEQEYAEAVSSEYAVDRPGDPDNASPWMDNPAGGWAPSLRLSPTGIPDATRENDGEYVTTHAPQSGGADTRAYWDRHDAEDALRHSVEDVTPFGLTESPYQGGMSNPALGANRYGRHPRETPPSEPRVTNRMNPHQYRFWRPFQGMTPHRFTGEHFSMADHRRDYEIYGMTPQRRPGGSTRNTYRLPPAPWDTYLQDQAPNDPPAHLENVQPEVPYASRSWRLG
jgi:hypothetical protein